MQDPPAWDNPHVQEFIESLLRDPHLADEVVYRGEIPAAPPRWGEPAVPLPEALRAAAMRLGVGRLYSHQATALDRLREGRHVALVTPTASGKSLVNYLPTAEMLEQEGGHALFLFPHKALEQDQLKKLQVFGKGLFGNRDLIAEIYDGDTPASKRRKIRAHPPDVLITNPDMLHMGFLAYHGDWARFFGSLRLVVIDELHVYRGVFGAHFAHVMRRLARVTAHYGASPLYLACSATVGNAAQFARTLLGMPFEIVSESGSPRAPRHFLFVNPVASPYTVATRIFLDSVRAGYRTIAFTKARKITELMHSWAEQQGGRDIAKKIASYRAGYLPEERREIEKRLFRGDLVGVIATSALELGIDVGGLDVCILVGYPGSMMSAWQRIGRVGRQDRESLVVLIAQPDALDQYFMNHPEEFFTRAFEPAVVDPGNPAVASAHAVCAGAEIALGRDEAESYVGGPGVEALLAGGKLVLDEAGERYFSLKRQPQREVNLRSGGESYAILADEGERPIGTIDGVRVFHECHEGAIYLHAGASYRVVRLDREAKRVLAVPFSGDYYTQALGTKETEILETFSTSRMPGYDLSLGRLKVTVLITEYAKKRLRDQETISKHPIDVPPIVFETIGFWMKIPEALGREATRRELHFMGGLHASEHAMISLFPLLALCDRSDVGGISYSLNPQLASPAIFIYDGYPGGIGLAASVHDRIGDLFLTTRRLLESCPCEDGCPSCVQSPRCGSGNRPLDKASALLILRHLTGESVIERAAAESACVAAGAGTEVSLENAGANEAGRRMIEARSGDGARAARTEVANAVVQGRDRAAEADAISAGGGANLGTGPEGRAGRSGPPVGKARVADEPGPSPERGHRASPVVPEKPPGKPRRGSIVQATPPAAPNGPRPGAPVQSRLTLESGLDGGAFVAVPPASPAVPEKPPGKPRRGSIVQAAPPARSGAAQNLAGTGAISPAGGPVLSVGSSGPRDGAGSGTTGTSGGPVPPARAAGLTSGDGPALPMPGPHAPFGLRPGEGRMLFFDVETQRSAEEVGGWGKIRDMGLALAVVYDAQKNLYTTFFEKDVEKLVLELVMADCVVGYNSERFDLEVLSAYGSWDLGRIRSFDMLKYIRGRLGFRLKLGDLAEANLGVGKSADGLQSLVWFKEGRLDLIEEYCRRDVEVTARLFFLGRERGYLLYRNYEGTSVRLQVEW